MLKPEHFRTSLLRQKRGVLLYGPPGTGKTMLAKALAKECTACFIVIKASTILSKWYGETNKMISAIWTLAYKLQPTILFIDEVDALLGSRSSSEHEATTAMKTEFMQLWEGFETDVGSNVVVLGATNKKFSLDDAVLRRFSLQYEVGLPSVGQREDILRSILRRYATEEGAHPIESSLLDSIYLTQVAADSPKAHKLTSLREIAERTEGFSGSDLKELCSQAAAIPVHEYLLTSQREKYVSSLTDNFFCFRHFPVIFIHVYVSHYMMLLYCRDEVDDGPDHLSKHHFEQVLSSMIPPSRAAQMVPNQRYGVNNPARDLLSTLEPLVEALKTSR